MVSTGVSQSKFAPRRDALNLLLPSQLHHNVCFNPVPMITSKTFGWSDSQFIAIIEQLGFFQCGYIEEASALEVDHQGFFSPREAFI